MELCRSQTNSATDSAGSVWGLPGNSFMLLVGSLIGSVTIMVVLQTRGVNPYLATLLAAVPTLVILYYISALVAGRPPHYDRDLLDQAISGKDFTMNPYRQPAHPWDLSVYDRLDRTKRVLR
jgi:hypothetical protein